MRKNNIGWGLGFIAVAVLLVANGMGFLPEIPWMKVLLTIMFAGFAFKQLFRRHFVGSMLALGCGAWIWDSYLGIEEITPFPLLLAAVFVGIGLNMLFGKKRRIVTIEKNGHTVRMDEARVENWEDGRHVSLENIFNSTNKYVNSEAFSSAEFNNVFGSANIYFNNAIIEGGEAKVDLENVFGTLNLYFPSTWRLQVNKESVFGGVNVYGKPSVDPDAPVIRMNAESVFGSVSIYFE